MKLKIIALFFLLVTTSLHAEELVKLETRTGIEQRFILIKPEKPVASVILFAGGKGTLKLTSLFGSPTINWGKNNFLVRTRDIFAKNGFIVAVVDAPSDRLSGRGMLDGFRDNGEHVKDINGVIDYLKDKNDIPVWLVGTSRGTESVINIALNSKQKINGLILTASMSEPNGGGTALTEMNLKGVTLPILVVTNSDDECWKTPPEGSKRISEMLTNSKTVKFKVFNGGDTPISGPCNAMSYHGFLGIENEVVNYISNFIQQN